MGKCGAGKPDDVSRGRTLPPEDILEPFSPEIVALVDELRGMVRKTDPEFVEAGYPGWKAVAFRHPVAGYVRGAFPFDDRVRFLLEHGIQLDDAAAILQGATRQTRHVDLRPGQPLPPAAGPGRCRSMRRGR